MRLDSRLRPVTLAMFLWSAAWASAEGPEAPAVVVTGPPSSSAGDEASFDLFPVGKPWLDVRVPRYNEVDQLTSIMHAQVLTREAERLLQMDGLTLAMFEPDRSLSLRVKTAKGIYDLDTGELKTRTKTFIEHPAFDMQGDSLVFDSRSGKGRLNGNVEMIIYTFEAPGASSPQPKSGK